MRCLGFRYWSPTVTVMTRQQAKILSTASDRWTLVIRRFPSSHSRWLEMLFCIPQLFEHGIKVARVKDVILTCTSILYSTIICFEYKQPPNIIYLLQEILENINLRIIQSLRWGDFFSLSHPVSFVCSIFQIAIHNN